MPHTVLVSTDPWPSASGTLRVHQIPAATDNLVWLLQRAESDEVAVVDGPDAGAVLDYLHTHRLRLTTILNTHTHGDHIGINRDLAARGRLAGLRVVGPAPRAAEVPGLTEGVDEGDTVAFSGTSGRVMRTEGHIDGHVSFVFEDVLFCGDTMFGGGCGYLFDGPPAKMHDSLQRLAALPEGTRVCCAHEYTEDNLRFAWTLEPDNTDLRERLLDVRTRRARGESTVPSTIGLELRTNPFLRGHSPTLRERVVAAMGAIDLDDPVAVFAATRALKDRKDYKKLPPESFPGGAA
jgi:hydroxyacylglutathione hydrolase